MEGTAFKSYQLGLCLNRMCCLAGFNQRKKYEQTPHKMFISITCFINTYGNQKK